jgi:hypothetical protein
MQNLNAQEGWRGHGKVALECITRSIPNRQQVPACCSLFKMMAARVHVVDRIDLVDQLVCPCITARQRVRKA